MTNILSAIAAADGRVKITDHAQRQKYGLIGGAAGVQANFLLFALKFFAGILTSSVAITADAFNNLSDAGSSIVTLIGFKLSGQKPDREHPFGHGRMEYLSGLAVAMAIILMGFELAKSSVTQIMHPTDVTFDMLSGGILVFSIILKLLMSVFNRRLGNLINSAALRANSSDSLGDAIATTAVLFGSVIGKITGLHTDGYLGLAVAAVILYAGYEAARDTITPLLGTKPDPEFVRGIAETVMAHKEIRGLHDLIVHDYGPGRRMISLHAEVSSAGNILALHDVIDNVEKELGEKFGCEAVIHMDPLDCDDRKTAETREKVAKLATIIDPGMTIHDFRMVSGPSHTNLIFDMVLPMESRLTPKQAREAMEKAVSVLDGPYFTVITVDRPYI